MAHNITNIMKVNVRVPDLKEASEFFEGVLGAELLHDRGSDTIGDFDGRQIKFGDDVIDMVAPNNPDGVLAKNIEKRGPGLDSLCLQVENLEDTVTALKDHGVDVINRTEHHGHKIAFIHPRDAFGILIEMIERPKESR